MENTHGEAMRQWMRRVGGSRTLHLVRPEQAARGSAVAHCTMRGDWRPAVVTEASVCCDRCREVEADGQAARDLGAAVGVQG